MKEEAADLHSALAAARGTIDDMTEHQVVLGYEIERLRDSLRQINALVEDRKGFILCGPGILCGRLINISRLALSGAAVAGGESEEG
jgi:hypothetical protein